jgi:hypothetical protein
MRSRTNEAGKSVSASVSQLSVSVVSCQEEHKSTNYSSWTGPSCLL